MGPRHDLKKCRNATVLLCYTPRRRGRILSTIWRRDDGTALDKLMPTSFVDHITPIMRYVMQRNPDTILDIGAGYGKYGLLCREYIDKWPWTKVIDAVEAFDYLEK